MKTVNDSFRFAVFQKKAAFPRRSFEMDAVFTSCKFPPVAVNGFRQVPLQSHFPAALKIHQDRQGFFISDFTRDPERGFAVIERMQDRNETGGIGFGPGQRFQLLRGELPVGTDDLCRGWICNAVN